MTCIKCKGCGKAPSQILEYQLAAKENGYDSEEEYVQECEGTFNPDTGLFWCTDCYVAAGSPLGIA